MLKNKALEYYKQGNNCSQCILKACNDTFFLNLPRECYMLNGGIYNGFGVGSVCSVLVACIMVIAYMYPQDNGSLRMKMTDGFAQKMGSINCGKIRCQDCSHIICCACDILEEIINSN